MIGFVHAFAWSCRRRVVIDPRELGDIQKRLAGGASKLTAREAIRTVLAGEARQDGLSIAVTASGVVAKLVESLRIGGAKELGAPPSLRATLRPYQELGLNWLVTMSSLGLGACLADDMGLGKTMQLLAFLLRQKDEARRDTRPALLVAPTSVVGNWEREIERFAPSIDVVRHYGASRARSAGDIPKNPGTLVVTTYGLLRCRTVLVVARQVLLGCAVPVLLLTQGEMAALCSSTCTRLNQQTAWSRSRDCCLQN